MAVKPKMTEAKKKPSPQKSRSRIGQQDFIKGLSEKVTVFDANMILEAAMLSAGVARSEDYFKKDEM